ncbi:BC1872 family protein [Brevibacillus laterosporus]|uniref:Phage ABA sandwich domain-containing protein n=1 Tax=Brevibacillus laterosporus TaxID=1465 RepID=A0AAP3DM67_BRELA|nr:hypothetical protein [Brevibacillus laterosporus]MCR8982639.1 hypothetical protein [Brevibacillus laterosporus]MCZ0809795.1 hypothetical protein [Brevibacillus laterosporus]MCZ0828371.1 hypothetical protein [Brevibacillus laterosporus]MCZ0852381.1 hypothetical protein [Brevibacillus laterosporus]
MTEQQIIVTLATKVMGWELLANDGLGWTGQRPDGVFVYEWNWNPLEDLNHAFQVVDKLLMIDKLLSHFYIFELFGSEVGWVAIFKLIDGNLNYPKMFEATGKLRKEPYAKLL